MIWLGLATRIWAVVALGASFRTTVEVDPGQAVVTTGPYRWIRHPSYTGLLLIAAGYGARARQLALVRGVPSSCRRWRSFHRIRIEEAEMEQVLGEPYRDYERTTKRLIPRVW